MKLAKFFRVITIPPIVAVVLILLLHFAGGFFPGYDAWWAIFFLAVMPSLSYGIWAVIPKLREKGRSTQRFLAVIFSVIGYIGGTLYCVFVSGSNVELLVYLTYLISGFLILIFSYVFHLKGSGHACGLAGPVAMMSYCLTPFYSIGFVLLGVVFWCSLKLKRHNISQLIVGSTMPIAAMAFLILIM